MLPLTVRAALVSFVPEPFRIPAFRAYWLARLTSTIAQMAMVIIIGWQVYDIARETMDPKAAALRLGIIGLVQFAPLFILTLVTGWTADRVDRRWVARSAVALELACALVLAWFAWQGTTTLAVLYGVAALLGVARAFAGPALGALTPNLVPRKILPNAIALSSIAWQSGAIAGPALGGYLYAWAPVAPYAGSALLFTVALIGLFALGPVARAETMATRNPWGQMVEGLRYVRRNRLVLGAISLDLFAVLLGGATAMLPVFARDVLHAGPDVFGALRAAPAIGAALVALVLARRPIQRFAGSWMFGGVAVFGLATLLFAVSREVWLSMLALGVLGAADMVSVFIRQTLVQIVTPDPMRGRVAAVSTLFIGASNELGEFESGVTARLMGPVGAALFGGFGALLVTGLWARLFPDLRKADRLE